MVQPPEWFDSSQYGAAAFSPYIFVEDLGIGMHTIDQTFQSPPTPLYTSGGSSGSSGFGGGMSAGGGFSGIGGGGSAAVALVAVVAGPGEAGPGKALRRLRPLPPAREHRSSTACMPP